MEGSKHTNTQLWDSYTYRQTYGGLYNSTGFGEAVRVDRRYDDGACKELLRCQKREGSLLGDEKVEGFRVSGLGLRRFRTLTGGSRVRWFGFVWVLGSRFRVRGACKERRTTSVKRGKVA